MKVSPTAVLDRITGGRGALAMRYSAVSIFGVVITVIQLTIYTRFFGWDPVKSNALAVLVSTGPAFMLNKRWVWSSDGKISIHREVIPFFVFTAMGFVLSTGLVALVSSVSDSHILVLAANLTGFGVLWLAKFLFLDKIMFGHSEIDEVLSQEAPEAA